MVLPVVFILLPVESPESPRMQLKRFTLFVGILLLSCTMTGCRLFDYLDRPRPMSMLCKVDRAVFIRQAADMFDRNGYSILEQDTTAGYLLVQDSVEKVAYRYTALVRTWRVEKNGDSVTVNVSSLSTRMDGSDVLQTWDKRWSGDEVKEWMRPVLTSLETVCGLSTPLRPAP